MEGPQTEAWLSEADELFYGGAAGGGKSDFLLGLAGTAHHKAIIFREQYPQLHDLVRRSHELYGQAGDYSERKGWQLSGRRSIEFGAADSIDAAGKFQGRAHDFKGFDEISNFQEQVYRFLIGWLRPVVGAPLKQRCRIVCAGNPPTNAQGEWVLKRWGAWLDGQHPHPAKPGELRWYVVVDGEDTEVADARGFEHKGKVLLPKSRTFIPARLEDNPFLMAAGYEATLQAMPEPLRSQMLYGDFTAGVGDDPWQVIPTDWVRQAQARWTSAIPASVQECVGVDVARGGKDKTVLCRRRGAWFALPEKHAGTETPDGQMVAGFVALALTDGGYANIDIIGVGASPYDLCRLQGLNVRPVNFAAGSEMCDKTGRLKFANVRAAAYWTLREALDPVSGDGLMLPPDPELLADLTSAKWSMRMSGIQVEAKEDIVKRIGRSPDVGDAVVLAAYTGGALPFGWLRN